MAGFRVSRLEIVEASDLEPSDIPPEGNEARCAGPNRDEPLTLCPDQRSGCSPTSLRIALADFQPLICRSRRTASDRV